MSQKNVERVIGRMVTDEAFRYRFEKDSDEALQVLAEQGIELTPCERHALRSLDPGAVARFAEAIDPRLQKSDLQKGMK